VEAINSSWERSHNNAVKIPALGAKIAVSTRFLGALPKIIYHKSGGLSMGCEQEFRRVSVNFLQAGQACSRADTWPALWENAARDDQGRDDTVVSSLLVGSKSVGQAEPTLLSAVPSPKTTAPNGLMRSPAWGKSRKRSFDLSQSRFGVLQSPLFHPCHYLFAQFLPTFGKVFDAHFHRL
jgi:hypothetical protein